MGPKYLEPLQRGAAGEQGGGQRADRHHKAKESVLHCAIPDASTCSLEALGTGLGTHRVPSNGFPCPNDTETDLAGRLH